ncbi:MAG: GTP cyclohydrolase II [Candidatus Micrarchaeota archaeon]|nr:GTP cyclohydrolase II [Candidatus Micrarchaeota archaeon]
MIKPYSEASLTTKFGKFRIYVFIEEDTCREHAVLVKGDFKKLDNCLVRIHSECKTGDVFGSYRCDCGPQLKKAFQLINKERRGIIIYLAQEGRGIGLGNKIKAYSLQEEGYDTVEANKKLGFDADLRDFKIAAEILKYFSITSIRLITNNPKKIADLEAHGIKVSQRIPCLIRPNRFNQHYLKTKEDKLGHIINSDKE